MKNMKIDANGTEIRVMGDVVNEDAYISLTDIAKYKNPDNTFIVVANWMRNHSTISFLGLWEQIHNPNFKPIEFDRFKAESGDNAFTLTPQQWIKSTDAIGIISKSGRYGGTYAHTDIAFEFASWISPEFKYGFVWKNSIPMEKRKRNKGEEFQYQRFCFCGRIGCAYQSGGYKR